VDIVDIAAFAKVSQLETQKQVSPCNKKAFNTISCRFAITYLGSGIPSIQKLADYHPILLMIK